LHLRVWGGESAPDKEHASMYTELIQKMIKGMLTSATSVRPDFKFILSGYTNYSDYQLQYLSELKEINPNIIAQIKWDRDWAVSNTPNIPKRLTWAGTNDGIPKTISISIPNEEAIPLWFPAVRLYQEGIQSTVKKGEETISGWPVVIRDWHLQNNDNALNVIAICHLTWNPFDFDTQQFYTDSYTCLWGKDVMPNILEATNLSNEAMSDFLRDYGGIVPGMDAGNWFNLQKNLIGTPKNGRFDKMIANIIDGELAELLKIKQRLEKVVPLQEKAADLLLESDWKVLRNREIFENMLCANQLWALLLKSRLSAVNYALNKKSSIAGNFYFDELIRYDKTMIEWIEKLTNVSAQSTADYTIETKADFINHIESELKYLHTLK